jgi:hypothetical protein
VQLFESVQIVASPGSPGSKPNVFDPSPDARIHEPSRTEADLRVAMETAEEQAAVSTEKHGPREYVPQDMTVRFAEDSSEPNSRSVRFPDDMCEPNGRSVRFHEDSIADDSSYGPAALSQSMRQASIASCASEWVENLKTRGSVKKR